MTLLTRFVVDEGVDEEGDDVGVLRWSWGMNDDVDTDPDVSDIGNVPEEDGNSAAA
jgi:hypothetical protein